MIFSLQVEAACEELARASETRREATRRRPPDAARAWTELRIRRRIL